MNPAPAGPLDGADAPAPGVAAEWRPSIPVDERWRTAEARARQQVRGRRQLAKAAIAYALLVPILWTINGLTTPGVPWAIWPTLGMGIALLIRAATTFTAHRFFGAEWEERKVAELMAREKLRVVSGEKQAVQAQLKLLQAQIEPHFLFNTLATIQATIRSDPPAAGRMMEDFIAYLRQTLTASRAQQGTLALEFSLIRQYLDLMRLRMAERLHCEIDLPAELADVPLAPMLLQPLVENAIRHGLEPKVEGGHIAVSARREAQQVLVVVQDSGLGFGASPDAGGTGVGLGHLRERLQLLYDGAASMHISDAAPGTRIELRLPLSGSAA